jgi:predicted dehydrogenase
VIAGSGHGCRVHLPALRAAGFRVVGLVGRDPERTRRRAQRHAIPGAFTDLGEAIEQTGATAVTVATPPRTHGAMVLTAVQRSCHVLCEKPFASDADEARELLEAAERAGVVHLLGHQMRALPERRAGGRALAEGLIGEPRLLTFVQHIDLLADTQAARPGWWFDREAGGGWLGASGSHMIDHVRSWLGDFASVSAVLPVVADRRGVAEDSFNVRFELANGLQGVLVQTAAAWGPMQSMSRVVGSAGTLWLERGEAWLADRSGTRRLPVPGEHRLVAMAPSEDPRSRFLHVELPPSIRLFETWRAAIEGRSGTEPFATFADGLATTRVIVAIRRSAAQHGALVPVD